MSRRGNTDAMCAKFTRFDRMYSHQPAAQVQATQSRATGVNTSTLALTQCLQPGMAVINIPKHHVLRRFSQAIPPLPPARSLARVSVPTARSPGDGCEYVNVSTHSMPPTWHGGHQHPQTSCFTQIQSSRSSAFTCTVTRTRVSMAPPSQAVSVRGSIRNGCMDRSDC